MVTFIYEHFDEEISVTDIAKAAFVSERECFRLFKTLLNTAQLTYYQGFPIWWGVAPRIVNSFLDQVDLTGKAVHVFVTSGSNGVDEAVADLKRPYPKLDIVEAERFGAII